jgi:hypothetical protein
MASIIFDPFRKISFWIADVTQTRSQDFRE